MSPQSFENLTFHELLIHFVGHLHFLNTNVTLDYILEMLSTDKKLILPVRLSLALSSLMESSVSSGIKSSKTL